MWLNKMRLLPIRKCAIALTPNPLGDFRSSNSQPLAAVQFPVASCFSEERALIELSTSFTGVFEINSAVCTFFGSAVEIQIFKFSEMWELGPPNQQPAERMF